RAQFRPSSWGDVRANRSENEGFRMLEECVSGSPIGQGHRGIFTGQQPEWPRGTRFGPGWTLDRTGGGGEAECQGRRADGVMLGEIAVARATVGAPTRAC